MFTITKDVYFCYGHRLMHHPGKCRHLHGHSVKASITVAAKELDVQGMVCDFSEVQQVASKYIDENLDHNFLLHRDDPLCMILASANERFLAIDSHPTAENLAKMIFVYMQEKCFAVTQVTLWETTSSNATYYE